LGDEIIHSPKLPQTFKEESPKIEPEKKTMKIGDFPENHIKIIKVSKSRDPEGPAKIFLFKVY